MTEPEPKASVEGVVLAALRQQGDKWTPSFELLLGNGQRLDRSTTAQALFRLSHLGLVVRRVGYGRGGARSEWINAESYAAIEEREAQKRAERAEKARLRAEEHAEADRQWAELLTRRDEQIARMTSELRRRGITLPQPKSEDYWAEENWTDELFDLEDEEEILSPVFPGEPPMVSVRLDALTALLDSCTKDW